MLLTSIYGYHRVAAFHGEECHIPDTPGVSG